jgi:predicted PurR-regulated permease PerM
MAEADDTPLLTPPQRRLVGAALSVAAVVGIFALVVFSLRMIGVVVREFSGVIWPIAVAGILALILQPFVGLLERRFRLRRLSAVIILYGIVVLATAGVLLAIAPAVIGQIIDFFNYVPTLWQKIVLWAESHFPEWLATFRKYSDVPAVKNALAAITAQAQDLATHILPSLKQAGAGLFGIFGVIASLAIIPVYLFFFLMADGRDPTRRLAEHLVFLQPRVRDDIVFLAREFVGIVVAFFRGQLLIGLIMGVLLATGFSLAGLKFGLALGIAIGLLNIVPYLGSILGLSIVLPLALLQPETGGAGLFFICIAIFVGVQVIEGWFLTPRIMGQQTGLHPVAIIFAVFFWGEALGGVLGMLLAVPLTAFFVTAWRLVRHKYLQSSPTDTAGRV